MKYLLIDGDSLAYMAMNSDSFEDATHYIDNLIYDMLHFKYHYNNLRLKRWVVQY